MYGLVFYAVGRSRKEIAVRMALGATPSDIRRQVLGRGLRQALVSVPLGLAASVVLARYLGALLPGMEELDPVVLAVLAAILVASVLLASWLPARRAMRLAPGRVLGEN